MLLKVPNNDTHYKKYKAGVYNNEIMFYKQILSQYESPILIEGGANVGFFSRKLANDCGEIHCFEPVSEVFNCLEHNTADLENVYVNKLGLYDENCQKEIHVSTSHCQGSSLDSRIVNRFGKIFSEKKEKIDLIKLSDYLKNAGLDRVHLVKLDIEGSEINVIRELFESGQLFDNIVFESYFMEDIESIGKIVENKPDFFMEKRQIKGISQPMYHIRRRK